MKKNDTNLGVEVLADGPDQVGDDLRKGFGASQCGADRVETLEIETLDLELALLSCRDEGFFLELKTDQGRRGSDNQDGQDRSKHVRDGIGQSKGESDVGDGDSDGHGDDCVGPPREEKT